MYVGRIESIGAEEVLVVIESSETPVGCAVLRTSADVPLLRTGDEVLVWCSDHQERACVIGVLDVPRSMSADSPDELVIEAKHSLTLKVGDGSITIREDGRILIKGRDLVSHAKRNNRIRGGSVQIN